MIFNQCKCTIVLQFKGVWISKFSFLGFDSDDLITFVKKFTNYLLKHGKFYCL